MAEDLAAAPDTGLLVQLCGDAHLANFGGYASPERRLVFDVNDFDETLPGPFEWDVKRLAASFELAARERGVGDERRRAIVLGLVRGYREAMQGFAEKGNLAVWYDRLDADSLLAELRRTRDERARTRVEQSIGQGKAPRQPAGAGQADRRGRRRRALRQRSASAGADRRARGSDGR